MGMQKINPKSWLSQTRSEPMVVHLDNEDWQKLTPMSDYMGMAPSKLCRVLLKQLLLRYPYREELDDNVCRLTTQMPVIRSLSPREMKILELAAQGTTNKRIAGILGISEQTVKNHISSILRKLEAENRTQAVVLALEQHLIEPKMSSQNNHDNNSRLVASVR